MGGKKGISQTSEGDEVSETKALVLGVAGRWNAKTLSSWNWSPTALWAGGVEALSRTSSPSVKRRWSKGIAWCGRGCAISRRCLTSAEMGAGGGGAGYRLLAGVDSNTGGKARLSGDSKLPLGGSKSGFSAYLRAWVQYPKSYLTY
jgi:hypothetical protein